MLWGGKNKSALKNKNFKQIQMLKNNFKCGKDVGTNVKILRLLSEPVPLEDSW